MFVENQIFPALLLLIYDSKTMMKSACYRNFAPQG